MGYHTVTIACVLRSGGQYHAGHVKRLGASIRQHIPRPYRFVCLTDMAVEGNAIPLAQNWPRQFSKIELFRPGLFKGRVLYLDLDVTVIGGLEEIARFPAPFAAIKDWQWTTINSSVMSWDAGIADHVYDNFDGIARKTGDQTWITGQMKGITTTFPPEWCPSFKYNCLTLDAPPRGARVIVFHGKPKPWELPPGHWAAGEPPHPSLRRAAPRR